MGVTVPENDGTAFKLSEKIAHTTRNGVFPLLAMLVLSPFRILHFIFFFFYIGIQLANNVTLVSGVGHRDSTTL